MLWSGWIGFMFGVMIRVNLQFANYGEIHDIVLRVVGQGVYGKNLTDLYFLWHPRTEHDFIKSYYDYANPAAISRYSDTDIVAEITGIKIHSYLNRSANEKELIIFIETP